MGELQKQNNGLSIPDGGMAKAIISSANLLGVNYTPQLIGQLTDFVNTNFKDITPEVLYERFEKLIVNGYETKAFSMNAPLIVKAIRINNPYNF